MSGERHLTAEDLRTLPVGAVVLDGGNKYSATERCAWSKSDDTARQDECGDRLRTAWASVVWSMDRTDEELITEFGPIFLLWDGVSTTPTQPTDGGPR